MTSLKDKILRYWFALSVFALAAIYFLYLRRGQDIETLKREAEKQLLAQKLLKIREQSRKSDHDYFKAMDAYSDLKRRHGDVLSRHGIFTGRGSKKSN